MPTTLGYERVFDDILVETKIVMSEKLVEIADKGEDLGSIMKKHAGLGFHAIRVKISGGEARIYRFRDRILAAILNVKGSKKYGEEALEALRGGSLNVEAIQVYSVPDDLLHEIIGEEGYRRITGPAEATPSSPTGMAETMEKPSKPVEKPAIPSSAVEAVKPAAEKPRAPPPVKPAPQVNVRGEIIRLLDDLGLEYVDVKVDEAEDNIKIYVELSPIPTWIRLRNILYSIVYRYVTIRGKYPVIKAEIKHGDEEDSILLIKQDEILSAAITGKIIHELTQNGVPVTDSSYEYDKDNALLTIHLKVKKPVYPGVKTEEVLRKAYEEAKTMWAGRILIRAKAGRFKEIKVGG